MELFIGIGFVVFGALLAYHNLKDTVDGEKSAVIFGGILLAIGIYMINDFNDMAKRKRAENDRKWEIEEERALNNAIEKIGVENYLQMENEMRNNSRYIPFEGNSGFNGKYKCRSTGCACSIKRTELESHKLIRCSCGHLTSYHYD